MRSERLVTEEGVIGRHRGFEALGVHASLRESALFRALTRIPDTRDIAQNVAEPASEHIALVFRHLQRLLDAVREPVAGEAEIWEHLTINSLQTGLDSLCTLSRTHGALPFQRLYFLFKLVVDSCLLAIAGKPPRHDYLRDADREDDKRNQPYHEIRHG